MEYGIETGMGHRPVPYCEWHIGTEAGTIILEWDEDAIVTNDVLIESVAGMNTDVARWLASLRLVLTQPKETLISLAKAKVIQAFYCPPEETTWDMIELWGGPGSEEIVELVEYYGWAQVSGLQSYFYHYVGDSSS
ncbi:MAG: hypothetical protein WCG99_02445 [Candidatus Berkelbacteria bacterium]